MDGTTAKAKKLLKLVNKTTFTGKESDFSEAESKRINGYFAASVAITDGVDKVIKDGDFENKLTDIKVFDSEPVVAKLIELTLDKAMSETD